MANTHEFCVYFTGRDPDGIVKTTRNTFATALAACDHAAELNRKLKKDAYICITACEEYKHKNGRLIREMIAAFYGKQSRSHK